ncbi:hypothetical protein [Desulfurobacterium sp.]
MGPWKIFKRKSDEVLFDRAVNERKHSLVVVYGARLISKGKLEYHRVIPYAESLFTINRKKEAVKILDTFAKEKLENGYFSEAIPLLTKAIKYDPENIETVKLLSRAYEGKNLLFEAFQTLIDLLSTFKNGRKNTAEVRNLIGNFLKRYPLPSFQIIYANI